MTKRKFYSELTKNGYNSKQIGQLVKRKNLMFPEQDPKEYEAFCNYILMHRKNVVLRILHAKIHPGLTFIYRYHD